MPHPLRRLALAMPLLLSGGAALGQKPPAAPTPWLLVSNAGTQPIQVLNASPATSSLWDVNLINPQTPLLPGRSLVLHFAPGADCVQDLRVGYPDRSIEVRARHNACTTAEVRFDGSRARQPQR
jgi:hypothetical protein